MQEIHVDISHGRIEIGVDLDIMRLGVLRRGNRCKFGFGRSRRRIGLVARIGFVAEGAKVVFGQVEVEIRLGFDRRGLYRLRVKCADIVFSQVEIEIRLGFGRRGLYRLRVKCANVIFGQAEIDILLGRGFGPDGLSQGRVEIGGKVEIDLCHFSVQRFGLDSRRSGLDGHAVLIRHLVFKRITAQKLFFEIKTEIVFGLFRLGRGRGRLPSGLARVETHNPRQFRKGIVVGKVYLVGDFMLVLVCHFSRTRTDSDAVDVAQGWSLPAQCGQKVTGTGRSGLAHFRGRIGPDQRQTGRQHVRNGLHQPESGIGRLWVVNLNKT